MKPLLILGTILALLALVGCAPQSMQATTEDAGRAAQVESRYESIMAAKADAQLVEQKTANELLTALIQQQGETATTQAQLLVAVQDLAEQLKPKPQAANPPPDGNSGDSPPSPQPLSRPAAFLYVADFPCSLCIGWQERLADLPYEIEQRIVHVPQGQYFTPYFDYPDASSPTGMRRFRGSVEAFLSYSAMNKSPVASNQPSAVSGQQFTTQMPAGTVCINGVCYAANAAPRVYLSRMRRRR